MISARRQSGAALISAIFLIVAIAAVAGMVANIATTQQLASGRALDATRAYYAARARMDKEIARVLATASCAPASTETISEFATDRVGCDEAVIDEGGASYAIYTIRVAAYRGRRESGSLVRRELRAVVTE